MTTTTKELNLFKINGSSKYVVINLSFYYLQIYTGTFGTQQLAFTAVPCVK